MAAAALLLLPAMSIANSLKPGPQPRNFTSAMDQSQQPYNLFIPSSAADGRPVPLVIALHGHGATWESWFKGTKVCEWAEKEGYAVLCPHGRGNYFYLSVGETDVWEALDDVRKDLPIDEDRIYLIGHSMGGWGTWNLAASKPDVFAAIVPMSAWAPLDLLGNVEYLNPLIIHGDKDPAVDVQRSRDADAVLTELGIPHKYIELPGVGHESSMISDMLPTIGDWIRGRKRMKNPMRIRLSTYTHRRANAWWLGQRGFPGIATRSAVNATLEGNVLNLAYDSTPSPQSLQVDLGSEAFSPFADSGLELRMEDGRVTRVEGRSIHLKNFLTVSRQDSSTTLIDRDALAPNKAPIIAKLTSPPERITGAIASLILEDTNVDGVFLSPSMFLPTPPTGEINYDDMFDYVTRLGGVTRANEGSGVFKVRGATLKERLADQKDWKPVWWEAVVFYPDGAIDDAKTYSVLVPPPLLTSFRKGFTGAEPAEGNFRDLRKIIMEGVSKKGEL
ncbi:alpha/beta fold hydrolase [Candidatus Sumerlaeota bacterium]|nr:alpha/beta fold hydrolase [Candidatus Sumerlaeota bacterium]